MSENCCAHLEVLPSPLERPTPSTRRRRFSPWNLLQLEAGMERYEALVYHMLYRALPVENKIDNGFLVYVVDLFPNKLESIPDEGKYTVLFLCIQMEVYPSALLLTEKGAYLHASGYDHEVFPRSNNQRHTMPSQPLHTIASRSLLTSARFIKWRELLVKAGINVAKVRKVGRSGKPLGGRRVEWACFRRSFPARY
jgi:hypothetical protein